MGSVLSGSWVNLRQTYLSLYADRSGVDDATPGILAAVAAATPTVVFGVPIKHIAIDQGVYALKSTCDLSGEYVRFVGAGGVLYPSLGTAGGDVLKATSGIFEMFDVDVDGGSSPLQTMTGTVNILRMGGGALAYMERVKVENCRFRNCTARDPLAVNVNASKVTHLFRVDGVQTLDIHGNDTELVSGSAMFAKNVASLRQSRNRWGGVQWYNVNLDYNVSGSIERDIFDCHLTTGVYWGGAINTVNNLGQVQNKNLTIRGCEFSGYFAYGGVIRLQSDDTVKVENNSFGSIQNGSLDDAYPDSQLTMIRAVARDPSLLVAASEPFQNIRIAENKALIGSGATSSDARLFIYLSNSYDAGRNPAYNLEIEGNICRSPDEDNYFSHGCIVNGQHAGAVGVKIRDNDFQLYLKIGTPAGGGISVLAADADGLVDDVRIGGNKVENLETPSTSVQTCIQIGAFVDRVVNEGKNHLIGGRYGVRTISGSGPTLADLDDQIFDDCTTDSLFSQPLTHTKDPTPSITATATAPAVVVTGVITIQDVTVPGAAVGDFVTVSMDPGVAPVFVEGKVRVADSVRLLYSNVNAASQDCSGSTVYIEVRPKEW